MLTIFKCLERIQAQSLTNLMAATTKTLRSERLKACPADEQRDMLE